MRKKQQEESMLKRMCQDLDAYLRAAGAKDDVYGRPIHAFPRLEKVARKPYKAVKRVLYGRVVEIPI